MVRAKPKAKGKAAPIIVADAEGRALLQLGVSAAPVEGAANAALVKAVAEVAGVAPSKVALEAGAQAKVKRFHITGDAAAILSRLAQSIEQ